jgi:hypothetical protein
MTIHHHFHNDNEVTSGPARVIWSEGIGLQPSGWHVPGGGKAITDRAEAEAVCAVMAKLIEDGEARMRTWP